MHIYFRGDNMLYYVYCRKSVYTGHGDSIENQKEMCVCYAKTRFGAMDNEIEIFEDEGYSGKNTKRPKFKEMIGKVESKRPDYIICYRLDRISRNVSDFSALIEYLNNKKTSLICISEEFDTSKPVGKAMMYIASVFAQLERETIAERVRDNMQMLARSGRWLGGTTPFGFKTTKKHFFEGEQSQTVFYLKNDAHEEKIVKKIYELYSSSHSFTRVANILSNRLITKRDGLPFSPKYVKQILTNPVYCTSDNATLEYFKSKGAEVFINVDKNFGITVYNKRSKTNSCAQNDMKNWIVATGRHKGIISGKDWVMTQKTIKNNIPDGKKIALLHNECSILSGVIICQNCSSRMFSKHRHNTDKYDYICAKKQNFGKCTCDSQNIDGAFADMKVKAILENTFGLNFSNLSPTETREILKRISKKVCWDNENLHIFLR